MAMSFHLIVTVGTLGIFTVGTSATKQESFSLSNYSFAAYKADFARSYAQSGSEHTMREEIFNQRKAEIIAHNSAGRSWRKGFNQFTDRTDEEMAAMRGYKRVHKAHAPSLGSSILEIGSRNDDVDKSCMTSKMSCLNSDQACCSDLVCGSQGVCEKPAAVTETKDWSELQTSKDVLNQGSCGSCWAVAAVAAIQLQAAKNHKNFNKVLSPQSMLSCTPNPMECGGQGGCKGATPELGFEWTKNQGKNGGLLPLDAQDYTATDDGATCNSKKFSFLQVGKQKQVKNLATVSIGGWRKVEENKASKVMDALVTVGPLAVAIVGKEIQGYESGVIDTCNKNFVVDHAVVMMGYGNDPAYGKYWRIRNSWGPDWGEQGFLRLRRHISSSSSASKEPCGWDNNPEVGVVCKNEKGEYPKRTWVCGECGVMSDVAYPVDVKVNPALLS